MNLDTAQILIVEDEDAVALCLEDALGETGAAIIGPARTVDQACELIGDNDIHAAVVDLIVDGVYCDAVAQKLLERGIPFAVTTGIGATADHPELQQATTIMKHSSLGMSDVFLSSSSPATSRPIITEEPCRLTGDADHASEAYRSDLPVVLVDADDAMPQIERSLQHPSTRKGARIHHGLCKRMMIALELAPLTVGRIKIVVQMKKVAQHLRTTSWPPISFHAIIHVGTKVAYATAMLGFAPVTPVW